MTTYTRCRHLLAMLVLALAAATSAAAQAAIDPELGGVFAQLPSGGAAEVIVTFHGASAPAPADLDVLRAAGISGGVTMRTLPMVGLLATQAQVNALAQNPRVRSVFWNKPLARENFDARQLTGVDRLRAEPHFTQRNRGLPVSGRGIGVVINDSGVDGTHPDLTLGRNLVQNVWAPIAREDLAAAGFNSAVFLENQPNTDIGSGHGTHVAGTVGGTGQASNGRHAGVAHGADLVGVGSGAVVLVLNTLAGFDYARLHQPRYNIRVVTNSWGSSGAFNPDNPINIATRKLVEQNNIVVLFSAGNRGGIETHSPYGAAPWAISVGNAVKNGTLAPSSSRGARGDGRKTATSSTGEVITYIDHPTVSAPGTNIVSARAAGGTIGDTDPFYGSASGTSMSTPHVAGMVALMLEANPLLTPAEVQRILQETATKMPGYERFEVGAGFVNAFAAVQKAFDLATPFGRVHQVERIIAAERSVRLLDETFNYSPASLPGTYRYEFVVEPNASSLQVVARYDGLEIPLSGNADNPLLLDVYDPQGNRYNAFQLYFALYRMKNLAVVVPNPMPGRWTAEVKSLTPLGVQAGNFLAFPDRVTLTSDVLFLDAPALADVPAQHEAKGAIDFVLTRGFLGPCNNNRFCPNRALRRVELARGFTQFGAVRQFLPFNGGGTFTDVSSADRPFVEAVAARGSTLRDPEFRFGGVIEGNGSSFDPGGSIVRAELAQMFVRGVGGEAAAQSHRGDVTIWYNGRQHVIADQDEIPAQMRGYVHVAINANMLNVYWVVEQGPFDLQPTLRAYFRPANTITRAEAAVAISRYCNQYFGR
jgi:serine protease AprX